MIHMLRALRDKVDSMQEQMGNVSKEMDVLRNNYWAAPRRPASRVLAQPEG